MNNLIPGKGTQSVDNRTVASKLQSRLRKTFGGTPDTVCLLLDISGSMAGNRIERLRELVTKFPGVRRFVFSYDCTELPQTAVVPDVEGGTSMHTAFAQLKMCGIEHCVMITDGEPDDPKLALAASEGLVVDVIFVGEDPAPDFLAELAKKRGGKYGNVSLDDLKAITEKVTLMLGPAPSKKGPIQL